MNLAKLAVSGFLMNLATIGFSYNFDDLSLVGKQNQVHVGPAFMTSKTEYRPNDGRQKYDAERKMVGVSASGAITDQIAGYAQLGRILESDLGLDANSPGTTKGAGYIFGGGAKAEALKGERASVIAFTQFNYLSEKYKWQITDDESVRSESSIYELSIGGLVAVNSNPVFAPYVGLELFPVQKGEMKSRKDDLEAPSFVGSLVKNAEENRTKFRRDDIVNIKMGANSRLNQFTVRGEISMISDVTLTLGTGYLF